jgi:hypothetical protein
MYIELAKANAHTTHYLLKSLTAQSNLCNDTVSSLAYQPKYQLA